MENYNPRQITRMRWKDARELEKFIFLSDNFNFQSEETIENASQDKLYFKIVNEIIKNSKNSTSAPLIIFDNYNGIIYVGYVNDDSTVYATYTASNANSILEFDYHGDTDILNIHLHDEVYVTEDNVKTIFGQDITGTGNIELYRHQITIRFDTDTKEVHYVVYSSSKTQIIDFDNFIAVAKPISNFNYPAIYVNGNNAEPAFIRFASGTILVGLSTGIEPYTGVSDNVTPI